MKKQILIALLTSQSAVLLLNAQGGPVASASAKAAVIETYTLPNFHLSRFGNPRCTALVVEQARTNGLQFTDLPSLGSGLAKTGPGEFVGITDRGPNGVAGKRRTFPLPDFCPAIVRFKLGDRQIHPNEFIPLHDHRGRLINGLSNVAGEERLYESAGAKTPLRLDENGVDPEAIRVLPDGNFLLSEEYSPSLLVVSPHGEVLMRYTPISKPLTNATYPVKAILPDVFTQRRSNHGFESLALSSDGRWAYAILQGPMGDEQAPRYSESRIIRAVKLDVSQPLAAKVVGEYLLTASAARDYSAKQKQDKISWSDAAWIAPDQLLVLERTKGEAKLLLVDLRRATNILDRRDANSLVFEDAQTLATLDVRTAESRLIVSTHDLPDITSDKLEGLVILSPTEIALSNDNDFGLGDNTTGEPSRVWRVRLPEALPPAEIR